MAIIKRKTFLSCAVVAGVVFAATALRPAPEAMATGSCSTFNPVVSWEGPCPVSSTNPTGCEASGPYTAVRYSITGATLDHLAAVVTQNNSVLRPAASQVYAPGDGDPITGLGKYSKHEKAIKANSNEVVNKTLWIVVDGTVTPVQQSVVAKKGFCIKSFAVPGLGLAEPLAAPVTESLTDHNGCTVEFTLDGVGGTVLSARLKDYDPLDPDTCTSPDIAPDGTLIARPAGDLQLSLKVGPGPTDVVELGAVNFGDGYANSGTSTCTTKIVGGKVYTYGKPCP